MGRRYAILDDNDRALGVQLAAMRAELPLLIGGRVAAALVIGSVAAGRARDLSDVDLVLVLRSGEPRRSDYDWWESEVLERLGDGARGPFPLQAVLIARSSVSTREPNLRDALRQALPLWDPEGLLDDQSEARG